MYRLDLVLVCAVAFGFGSWRSVWTDVGALLWIITVLVGVQVFLEWRYWYPSLEISVIFDTFFHGEIVLCAETRFCVLG